MNRELQRLRVSGLELGDFVSIVGSDQKMRAIFTFASKVAHGRYGFDYRRDRHR